MWNRWLESAVVGALVVVLLSGLIGCSKKTPQEVIDVNRELAQAKDGCAGVYATGDLERVQTDVDAMNALADGKKMRKARKAATPLLPEVQQLGQTSEQAKQSAEDQAGAAIKKAESAVDGARQAEAATYNARGLSQAEAKLTEAKRAAADPCRYVEAKGLAEDAARQGDAARQAAVAEKARVEEERRRAEEERRRREEEEARRLEEERRKNMFPPTYVVQRGDSLWRITGLETVYGDPVEWPILHDANQSLIQDPDLIYPGQELTIPREMTEEQRMKRLHQLWGRYGGGTP